MGYRGATEGEILNLLSERFLTDAGHGLGEFRVSGLAKAGHLRVVDALDLSSGDAYAHARLVKAGVENPSAWTVVAVVDRDESYWCDIEGKWEYCSTDHAVIVPTAMIADELLPSTEWDHAVKAGYTEYA